MIPHSFGRAACGRGNDPMNQTNQQPAAECPVRCPHCAAADRESEQPLAGPQGWRLVTASIGVFLLPLGLALAGAAGGGETKVGQFVGAVAGLAAGLAGSVLVARLIRRTGKEAR